MTREELCEYLEKLRKTLHLTGASAEEIAKAIFKEATAMRDRLDPGERPITPEEIKGYLEKDRVIKASGMTVDELIHSLDPP
jgi:hypothetical protein